MASDRAPHGETPRWTADMIRDGDPYELSDGQRIVCLPASSRHMGGAGRGVKVISTDAGARRIGTVGPEGGVSTGPHMLRAPDVLLSAEAETGGWITTAPPLALEIADRGQDEVELHKKIQELLIAGTKYYWVVRNIGPRRVEVYTTPGEGPLVVLSGGEVDAVGVLDAPIPVDAFYDEEVADRIALRNMLAPYGYQSVEELKAAVHAEAKAEGKAEGRAEGVARAIIAVLQARDLEVSEEVSARLLAERDLNLLNVLLRRALFVQAAAQVLDQE